jgi:ABC-type cobalamin/Fe3+-siderophores transport system ATPase subunit
MTIRVVCLLTKMLIITLCRDESFNSITGLNGSGKSNILDAICFVLGITNMTTVRAQNQQVYTFEPFQPICDMTDRALPRILSTSAAKPA